MRRGRSSGARRAALGLPLLLLGCEPLADLEAIPNPVPVLRSVSPGLLPESGSDVTLEVRGFGFASDATVSWDGSTVPTVVRDSTLLDVTLPTVLVSAGDSALLIVTNPEPGGGASAPYSLAVGYPTPTVTAVTAADSTAASASSLTLVVLGSGFATGADGAQVFWGSVPLASVTTSATRIDAIVPDYLLQVGTPVSITVRNPQPGGGVSAPRPFQTLNPLAQILGLNPAGLRVDAGGTVRIEGAGFVPGLTVTVDGAAMPAVLESDSVLHLTVPGQLALRGDTLEIVVANAQPGGGTSGPATLPIWEEQPRLDRLSPPWAYTNGGPFTLSLIGARFAPDATVRWGGVSHAFTFVGQNRLDVPITAGDLATLGDLPVDVINPRNGGYSATRSFTVLPPFTLPTDAVLTEAFGGVRLSVSQMDGGGSQTYATPELAFRPDARPGVDEVAYHRADRVYVRDLSTNTERPLLDSATSAGFDSERWPRYAPDGSWVYFTATVAGARAIWRVLPDGTGAEPIFDPAQPWVTHWVTPSSSGTKLSFSNSDLVMWTYDLQTYQVASLPGTWAQIGRWSPNDAWIAYTSPTGSLYIVRSDGSELLGPMPGRYGPVVDWLPDGSRLVAVDANAAVGVLIEPWLQKVDTLSALDSIGSIMLWRNE